jgi:murein DD-endopeptidase MepM/ murein hydrolase activator NlpD
MIFLNSCAVSQPDNNLISETPFVIKSAEVTITKALPTQIPTITEVPTETAPLKKPQICSPIHNVLIEDISGMIFNPFYPPVDGSDDPHQGVDLSDVDINSQIAKTGAQVDSIINGKVSMVIKNRFPYGNAVVIETQLEELPETWQNMILTSPQPEAFNKSSVLTCPKGWNEMSSLITSPALYILYAHLENLPDLVEGELVQCGDALGSIGMSGNALAPHVHIEMRYGPPLGLSGSMSHYDVSASVEEMSNYCRWRVSGWYRLLDPISLILHN